MNEFLQLLTVPSALRETQTSKTRRFFLAPCFDKGMSTNLKYVGQKLKMKMVNMIKVMYNPKKDGWAFPSLQAAKNWGVGHFHHVYLCHF